MLTTPSLPPPPTARETMPCAPQVPASVQAARLCLRPLLLAALDYLAAAPQATLYLAVCQGADEHRADVPAWLTDLPSTVLDATGCDAADALVAMLGEEVRRAA